MGVAAHIVGAQKGAARYEEIPAAERAAASNGIWLCALHAKAIDDDEDRFTVELLHKWKSQARRLAEERIDESRPLLPPTELIAASRRIAVSPGINNALRKFVNDFLADVGVPAVWGDETSESVRLALQEIGLNAATHGAAKDLGLASHRHALVLRHDGGDFGPRDLAAASLPRGGAYSWATLTEEHRDALVTSYRRTASGVSKWIVADLRRAPSRFNPCIVKSGELDEDWSELEARTFNCAEVHVYLRELWAMSDGFRDLRKLQQFGDRPLILHNVKNSPALRRFLRDHLPTARLAGAATHADRDAVKPDESQ